MSKELTSRQESDWRMFQRHRLIHLLKHAVTSPKIDRITIRGNGYISPDERMKVEQETQRLLVMQRPSNRWASRLAVWQAAWKSFIRTLDPRDVRLGMAFEQLAKAELVSRHTIQSNETYLHSMLLSILITDPAPPFTQVDIVRDRQEIDTALYAYTETELANTAKPPYGVVSREGSGNAMLLRLVCSRPIEQIEQMPHKELLHAITDHIDSDTQEVLVTLRGYSWKVSGLSPGYPLMILSTNRNMEPVSPHDIPALFDRWEHFFMNEPT